MSHGAENPIARSYGGLPAGPPAMPGPPWPARRILLPVRTPAGIVTLLASFAFDANGAALTSLLAEWSRTDLTYENRVAHLRFGGGAITHSVVMRSKSGGWLKLKEKLLAVPLNGLTASADGKHLLLNAEKSRVEMSIWNGPVASLLGGGTWARIASNSGRISVPGCARSRVAVPFRAEV